MSEKLEMIQMIIKTHDVELLNKIKALLLQKIPTQEVVFESSITDKVWSEVEQIRKERQSKNGNWTGWEAVKEALIQTKQQ